jgi:hypothetical protein
MLWRATAVVVVLAADIFVLAYTAGAKSGGLDLREVAALPRTSMYWLAGAILAFVGTVVVIAWAARRVACRVGDLSRFAETVATGDPRDASELTGHEDDFAGIARDLGQAAQRWKEIATAESELAGLVTAVADLRRALDAALAGDTIANADTTNSHLAGLAISLNALLARVAEAEEQQVVVAAAAAALSRATEPLEDRLVSLRSEAVEAAGCLKQLTDTLERLRPIAETHKPLRSPASSAAKASIAIATAAAATPQAHPAVTN